MQIKSTTESPETSTLSNIDSTSDTPEQNSTPNDQTRINLNDFFDDFLKIYIERNSNQTNDEKTTQGEMTKPLDTTFSMEEGMSTTELTLQPEINDETTDLSMIETEDIETTLSSSLEILTTTKQSSTETNIKIEVSKDSKLGETTSIESTTLIEDSTSSVPIFIENKQSFIDDPSTNKPQDDILDTTTEHSTLIFDDLITKSLTNVTENEDIGTRNDRSSSMTDGTKNQTRDNEQIFSSTNIPAMTDMLLNNENSNHVFENLKVFSEKVLDSSSKMTNKLSPGLNFIKNNISGNSNDNNSITTNSFLLLSSILPVSPTLSSPPSSSLSSSLSYPPSSIIDSQHGTSTLGT